MSWRLFFGTGLDHWETISMTQVRSLYLPSCPGLPAIVISRLRTVRCRWQVRRIWRVSSIRHTKSEVFVPASLSLWLVKVRKTHQVRPCKLCQFLKSSPAWPVKTSQLTSSMLKATVEDLQSVRVRRRMRTIRVLILQMGRASGKCQQKNKII